MSRQLTAQGLKKGTVASLSGTTKTHERAKQPPVEATHGMNTLRLDG